MKELLDVWKTHTSGVRSVRVKENIRELFHDNMTQAVKSNTAKKCLGYACNNRSNLWLQNLLLGTKKKA